MRPPPAIAAAVLATALVLPPSAPGETASLEEAESEFARKTHDATAGTTQKYIAALESLEKQMRASGRADDLKAVLAEIAFATELAKGDAQTRLFAPGAKDPIDGARNRPVEATLSSETGDAGSEDIPSSAAGDIVLSPKGAALSGGVTLMLPEEILVGFTAAGGRCEWAGEAASPGVYDLILDFSASAEEGGGGVITVAVDDTEGDISVTPEGSWSDFRKSIVGGVPLSGDGFTLTLTVKEPAGGPRGVLALRTVILRPRLSQ